MHCVGHALFKLRQIKSFQKPLPQVVGSTTSKPRHKKMERLRKANDHQRQEHCSEPPRTEIVHANLRSGLFAQQSFPRKERPGDSLTGATTCRCRAVCHLSTPTLKQPGLRASLRYRPLGQTAVRAVAAEAPRSPTRSVRSSPWKGTYAPVFFCPKHQQAIRSQSNRAPYLLKPHSAVALNKPNPAANRPNSSHCKRHYQHVVTVKHINRCAKKHYLTRANDISLELSCALSEPAQESLLTPDIRLQYLIAFNKNYKHWGVMSAQETEFLKTNIMFINSLQFYMRRFALTSGLYWREVA